MSSTAGLRRRNTAAVSDEQESTVNKALDRLKSFDVYAKVQEDVLQKSQAGGIVTVITAFVIAVLMWSELWEFCTIEVVDTVCVDTRLRQKLSIGLNVTFPHLRCDDVSVDNVDSSGDNQVNVHGSLAKLPLNEEGYPSTGDALKAGDCLSCMEAADEEHRCCNTCQELKDAYHAKDLSISTLAHTPQCRSSIGCRIEGTVVVNKVSGNVHVALGRSTIRSGKHVHEFNVNDVSSGFNTSHEIHEINFGERVPGMMSPLDGTTKIVRSGAYMFHYYIKLVPTVFTSTGGEEVYTHQYSVTDSARNVQVRSGELSGLPGVFIVYDFSPFLMRKTEKAKPWSYIFTSICAIIGGVYNIAFLVEMFVNNVLSRMMVTCMGEDTARAMMDL
eukprot:TRINITY_DN80894_c0_g1_i1.p1 TRINITY_DN80894_c0_g1~~TRINITY_DN80894_c0_g1_i1.p1  ORF type:complete len:387 (-),score=87.90 TRINITY_DN80894_c0_g1_i1:71-1231(-)